MIDYNLIIVLGATAVGKTKLAVRMAQYLDTEIISADSRQVYQGMDIGTGKDLNEYVINEKQIKYHLINSRAAGEKYHVNDFKNDFFEAFQKINQQNKIPILCGGTGMYIHSILQNHDLTAVPTNPELRAKLEELSRDVLIEKLKLFPSDLTQQADFSTQKRIIRAIEIADYLSTNKLPKHDRPTLKALTIGLYDEREIRREKILKRLAYRLEHGLIAEVQDLKSKSLTDEMLQYYGLEYKFVNSYLNKELSFVELQEQLGVAICQFAKRQMTFFRKMEKDGVQIHWLKVEDNMEITIQNALALASF